MAYFVGKTKVKNLPSISQPVSSLTDLFCKHSSLTQLNLNPHRPFRWLIAVCAIVQHIKNSKWNSNPIYIFFSFKISVLTVADTVRTCSLDQCYKTFLSPATSETKRKMSTFVSSIKSSDSPTQHAAGFQKAFQLIRSTNNSTKSQASKSVTMQY